MLYMAEGMSEEPHREEEAGPVGHERHRRDQPGVGIILGMETTSAGLTSFMGRRDRQEV